MNDFYNRQIQIFRLRVKAVPCFLLGLLLLGGFDRFAQAQERQQEASGATGAETKGLTLSSACAIKNCGKVNDFILRGGQPTQEEYKRLAAMGVKTVIDLRDDPTNYARRASEAAGLRYLNLPLDDKSYPSKQITQRFLAEAQAAENWPIFVHCAGGRHRTGAMIAAYRMSVDGWDVEKTYDEMKDYKFYTRWGHGDFKKFVYDYWKELQAQRK